MMAHEGHMADRPETSSETAPTTTISTVTRLQLAGVICRLDKRQSRGQARALVDQLFAEIQDGLREDGVVSLSGFGVFTLKIKAERLGRNPKTGEEHPICARKSVRFSPCQAMRLLVSNTRPGE